MNYGGDIMEFIWECMTIFIKGLSGFFFWCFAFSLFCIGIGLIGLLIRNKKYKYVRPIVIKGGKDDKKES